jgi:hypothetical protein
VSTAADLMAALLRVQQLATQLINEKAESDRAVIDAVRDLNAADLRLQRLIEERQQEG